MAGEGEARTDLVTEAYRALRDMIVTSQLPAGAPVIETQIAKQIGHRRTTVRSALKRLQHEGYVISTSLGQYSRALVAPLTEEDAEDLYTIVGALEGAAAREAARLGLDERTALAEDLARLNEELQALSRAKPPNLRRLNDADVKLHRRLVESAAGPRLLSLHAMIKPQAERYSWEYTSALSDEVDAAVAEHEEIIDALREGDGERARAAVDLNWCNAAKRVRQVMEHLGERGTTRRQAQA